MEWKGCFCLILLVVAHSRGQNAESEGDASTSPKVNATDRICSLCDCEPNKIDCRDKNIEGFFTRQDWEGIPDKEVTEIDLSGNSFSNITAFPELVKLEVLNLSRCDIVDIEDETFRDLKALRVLDLSRNRLTFATLDPNVFQGRYSPVEYEPLDELRTLDLSSNDLHSLDKDLFEHTPDLTELILNDNPFNQIDHATIIAIGGLPKLKVLKMRSCQLEELPERFLHTPRDLQHLDLSDNNLKTIPQEIREAQNLVFLNLNQNPIVRIERDDDDTYTEFPVLPKLKELHLCGMDDLEYIGPYALGGLTSLDSLHISNNPKLSEIAPKALARSENDGDSFVWPPVKKIYLKNNNLTSLDSRLVSRWDQLTALDVSGNPYVCDCTNQWMVDVLSPIADDLQANASAQFVCADPVEMVGKTMQLLNQKHSTMRCLDKFNHHPERDGALLLGTLIGVLLAVPLVLTLLLLWRRGFFAPCGASGPADFSRAFYKRAETDDFHI